MALRAHPRRSRPPRPAPELRRALRRRRMQRMGARTHLAAAVALAAALVLLINALVARFDLRWRLPGEAPALAPRTLALLAGTHGRLAITALVPRTEPAFERLRQLLGELRDAAAADNAAEVRLAYVDPYRDVALATRLARSYGTTGHVVVFERDSQRAVVRMDEMLVAGPATPGSPAFHGEQACAAAIARLFRPAAPVVYALSGHGERDLADYDPQTGYASLAREIRREGYDLRTLALAAAGEIPADCDALLVAGPRRALAAEETAQVQGYLARGGRLLLLADRGRNAGFVPVLESLGLRFADLTAVGPRTPDGYALVVEQHSDHPITRDLANTAVRFVSPQVIELLQPPAAGGADRPQLNVVVAAPPGAWGEVGAGLTPHHFDPGVDRRGFLPLVVAIQRGVGSGKDLGLRPLRAVVIGDSHFAANAMLEGGRTGNRDLLLNALDWLTDNALPTAPSAELTERLNLGMTRRKRLRFALAASLLWPLCFVLLGSLVVAIRRR